LQARLAEDSLQDFVSERRDVQIKKSQGITSSETRNDQDAQNPYHDLQSMTDDEVYRGRAQGRPVSGLPVRSRSMPIVGTHKKGLQTGTVLEQWMRSRGSQDYHMTDTYQTSPIFTHQRPEDARPKMAEPHRDVEENFQTEHSSKLGSNISQQFQNPTIVPSKKSLRPAFNQTKFGPPIKHTDLPNRQSDHPGSNTIPAKANVPQAATSRRLRSRFADYLLSAPVMKSSDGKLRDLSHFSQPSPKIIPPRCSDEAWTLCKNSRTGWFLTRLFLPYEEIDTIIEKFEDRKKLIHSKYWKLSPEAQLKISKKIETEPSTPSILNGTSCGLKIFRNGHKAKRSRRCR